MSSNNEPTYAVRLIEDDEGAVYLPIYVKVGKKIEPLWLIIQILVFLLLLLLIVKIVGAVHDDSKR